MSVIGTWAIQSSPDFDDTYLHLERPAYVTLRREGDRVAGEYHVGVQAGSIDGRDYTFEATRRGSVTPP